VPGREDFDRYVDEHGIPRRTGRLRSRSGSPEPTGGPVPRFEKVEPGDEQILEDREQRDLDAVPSVLALRYDEDASGKLGTP
jgi:hypothetical protein